MRQVLHTEIAKEMCNAKALGAFTGAVKQGYKIANDFGENEAVGFWKYNMTKGVTGGGKEYALAIGAYRNLQERGILSK